MAERLKKEIVEKEKAVDVIAGPDAYRYCYLIYNLPTMIMK